MSYFKDLDIALRINGIKKTSGPKCQCGRLTQIVGFVPKNTLEVVCNNSGCRLFNQKFSVNAYESNNGKVPR